MRRGQFWFVAGMRVFGSPAGKAAMLRRLHESIENGERLRWLSLMGKRSADRSLLLMVPETEHTVLQPGVRYSGGLSIEFLLRRTEGIIEFLNPQL